MAIVYQHTRKDTGEIFYIGIGVTSTRVDSTKNRSNHWHNIVENIGYDGLITHEDITWEEACVIEKYLIAFYGRRDLGLGSLINLTDGGDGISGYRHTEESKIRIRSYSGDKSWNYGRVLTEEHINKIVATRKARGTKGHKPSEDHKRRISVAQKRKSECSNCGLIGNSRAMKRWHFDNCRKAA